MVGKRLAWKLILSMVNCMYNLYLGISILFLPKTVLQKKNSPIQHLIKKTLTKEHLVNNILLKSTYLL